MRHVLDIVTDDWQPVIDLANTRAGQESIRRACKRLAAQGLVEIGYQRLGLGPTSPAHLRDIQPEPGEFGRYERLVVRRAQKEE
jgi:hypothetical protein